MPRKTCRSIPVTSANPAGFNEAAARCRGKHPGGGLHERAGVASMRPRPDAAENLRRREGKAGGPHASMRPRPDAAENVKPESEAIVLDMLLQ